MTLTREETIERLKQNKAAAEYYAGHSRITAEIENALKDSEAFGMAIEALYREEAEEKGYCHRIRPSNMEVVVRCKDCKWEFICKQTVEHANADVVEHRPLEWCSFGERRSKNE